MRSKWSGVIRATGLLSLCALIVFLAARVVGAPSYSFLYGNNFAFVPGHWVRYNIDAITEPSKTCLLVGTSVVREGFDSELMASAGGGARFANVATTGGAAPIDTLDIQSAILGDTEKRFACIVVGLNKFYVNRLNEKSYDLVRTDYLSQLSFSEVISFVRFWPTGAADSELFSRLMRPLGEHVVVLQRWWRYLAYIVRQGLTEERVELRSHELRERELMPASQYNYEDTEPAYAKAVKRTRNLIAEYEMENPSVYQSTEPTLALRRALGRLGRMTDRLYIVEMPLTSIYEGADEAAARAFESALSGASYDMRIRCKVPEPLQQDLFFDTAHLNRIGRQRLSKSVAVHLQSNSVGFKDDLCEVVPSVAAL